ncbi:MAG: twin-arginine translocase subunit TatC [Legionellaceae bacterium]|nr:twin-arginine translocase subunit TatC [Legionellaceae bacterium]
MLNHIIEIRSRIIYVIAFFAVCFGLFFFIADDIFQLLTRPLSQALPKNQSLVATNITTPLFTPINIAANAAFIMTAPFAILHIWRFVFPALYDCELYKLRWALISGFMLFIAGIIFCYFLVLPFVFNFIVKVIPSNVHLLPDMGYTVDFITRMLLIFGLCFQLPLIAIVLVQFKLITICHLKLFRPYFVVLAFILGMLLTPPDVFSQIMLALPLVALYELSIYLAKLIGLKFDN